jgi:hypothetical protein
VTLEEIEETLLNKAWNSIQGYTRLQKFCEFGARIDDDLDLIFEKPLLDAICKKLYDHPNDSLMHENLRIVRNSVDAQLSKEYIFGLDTAAST